MNWKFHFKEIDASESLKEYCREKWGDLEMHLLKESDWHVSFSQSHHTCEVSVTVRNPDAQFKAHAECDSFHAAVDELAHKLNKQFLKRKSKLQDHRNFERSKQGRLMHVNAMLESDEPILPVPRSKKTA